MTTASDPPAPSHRRRRLLRACLRVLTVMLLVLLVLPLLLPSGSPRGTVDPRELAGPDSRWLEVDGVDIHYEDYGDPGSELTLVLLHGFGASTFSWRDVAAPLAARTGARIVAFDRPGFGLTERPMPGDWQGETPYSDTSAVRLTFGLLDALGIRRAVLIGHSAGGHVAALAALEWPERVAGLVLVAPALGGGHGLPAWLRALGRTPQMRRIGPWAVRAAVGRLQRVLDMAWYDPSQLTPDILEGYRKPLTALNWNRALWEIMLAPRAAAPAGRVGELVPPALYITGDADRIVPAEGTRAAAAATPGADLLVLERCGHLPQEEYPAEFLEAVVGFLGSRGLLAR